MSCNEFRVAASPDKVGESLANPTVSAGLGFAQHEQVKLFRKPSGMGGRIRFQKAALGMDLPSAKAQGRDISGHIHAVSDVERL